MSAEATLKKITKAKGAHAAWKLKLSTAISLGKTDLDPQVVKCDDQCEFGKWLYGSSIEADLKTGVPYSVIRRLHAEFHVCASQVLDKINSGDLANAKTQFDSEYDHRSSQLLKALTKWSGELSA